MTGCEEYLLNMSILREKFGPPMVSPYRRMFLSVKSVSAILLPTIFSFGVIGNVLNLVVLTRKRLRGRLNVMEKSAIVGLFALAISDLLFCMCGLPYEFLERHGKYGDSFAVTLTAHYKNLYPPLMNTFLLSSTWIIVYISVERYIGVVYPFKAREIVSLARTMTAIVLIYVTSFLLNIPLFMKSKVVKTVCGKVCPCHKQEKSPLFEGSFPDIYHVIWGILGTFIPLAILLFCNVSIGVTILRRRSQEGAHYNSRTIESAMRATSILLSIVVMFFVLVCPSMILKFLYPLLPLKREATAYGYRVAVIVFNITQAINFAINFVLYCSISRSFREALRYSMACQQRSRSLSHTPLTWDGTQRYQLADKRSLHRQSTCLTSQSV